MQGPQFTRDKIATSLNVLPALELIWHSGPRWALATAGITLLQGVLPPVSLYLLKLIVDAVESGLGAAGRGPPGVEVDFAPVAGLIALAAGVALLGAALQAAAAFVGEAQALGACCRYDIPDSGNRRGG